MKDKIELAREATAVIQQHAGEAIDLLQHAFNGRIVNGFGIYSDRMQQINALRAAARALHEATQLMLDTKWPTDAEMETAER